MSDYTRALEGIDPEVALARMVNMIPEGYSLLHSSGRWFYGPIEPGRKLSSGKTPLEALLNARMSPSEQSWRDAEECAWERQQMGSGYK